MNIKYKESSFTAKPIRYRWNHVPKEYNDSYKNCTITSTQTTCHQKKRLAGKCSFTTTHLFGRVGRAPLRALYDKSHSTTSTINNQTRTAIIALREILSHCLPKTVPLQPEPQRITIVYTDAFFSDGNTQFRNCDFADEDIRPDFDYDHTNGWAAVIFPPGQRPTIIHGSVPRKILQHFASNKAYIYFLEAWAAIITPVLTQPLLTNPYVQLCDNDPATRAINKGSGKHQPLNNLTWSDHTGPGITDNNWHRYSDGYLVKPTLQTHSAEGTSPSRNH